MNTRFFELLFVHVWQVSILFVLIWVITKVLHRSANRRFPHLILMLWIAFFLKCLTPPIIESPVVVMNWLTPSSELAANVLPRVNHLIPPPESIAGLANQIATDRTTTPSGPSFGWVFIAIWALGSGALGFFYFARYLRVAYRVRQEFKAVQGTAQFESVRGLLDQQLDHLGIPKKAVSVIPTTNYSIPFAFGFFRGSIVLPASIVESPSLLRLVLAHELCHLWRRDHWVGWLQMTAQITFWFHPAIWLASRHLDQWCEICCDDDTMRIFSIKSTNYAKGLVDVLSLQSEPKAISWAPGLRPAEITKRRVRAVLNRSGAGIFRRTCHVAAILTLLLILPASASSDHKFGLVFPTLTPQSYPPPTSGPQSQLNFLIGHWTLYTAEDASTPTGHSEFHYEKSGHMIREDWTGLNGMTAQGITFYDPSNDSWRMTWVDSSGTIMESTGTWADGTLSLSGIAKDKLGKSVPTRVRLKRETGDMLITEFAVATDQSANSDATYQVISTSVYRRESQ